MDKVLFHQTNSVIEKHKSFCSQHVKIYYVLQIDKII